MANPGRKPGGKKTGGRQPGTPNRTTQALADRIKERMGPDWCPITAMAELAEAKDLPVDLRLRALAEVAPYLHAKRKPQPEVAEAVELAEKVQAARLRAMRNGGVGLEELVISFGAGSGEPVLCVPQLPLAPPPAETPPRPAAERPHLAAVQPFRMPASPSWRDGDGAEHAVTDYDPLSRN